MYGVSTYVEYTEFDHGPTQIYSLCIISPIFLYTYIWGVSPYRVAILEYLQDICMYVCILERKNGMAAWITYIFMICRRYI